MKLKRFLEFYTITEETINDIMILIEQEVNISPAVMKKTTFRFHSFMEKAKGDWDKFSRMINLRTKKMNKIDKLIAWFKVLENENFHTEAEIAYKRLRELGYKGAV